MDYVTPRAGNRVIVIGLDACDRDLVTKWSAEGRLPTLARLRETGAWGIIESPPGLFVGAAWPSFWKAIGDAGRRVAVVDVSKTYPNCQAQWHAHRGLGHALRGAPVLAHP